MLHCFLHCFLLSVCCIVCFLRKHVSFCGSDLLCRSSGNTEKRQNVVSVLLLGKNRELRKPLEEELGEALGDKLGEGLDDVLGEALDKVTCWCCYPVCWKHVSFCGSDLLCRSLCNLSVCCVVLDDDDMSKLS